MSIENKVNINFGNELGMNSITLKDAVFLILTLPKKNRLGYIEKNCVDKYSFDVVISCLDKIIKDLSDTLKQRKKHLDLLLSDYNQTNTIDISNLNKWFKYTYISDNKLQIAMFSKGDFSIIKKQLNGKRKDKSLA